MLISVEKLVWFGDGRDSLLYQYAYLSLHTRTRTASIFV